MNLPNKLTVARIIATPVFLAIMLADRIMFNSTVALFLFIAASLTDLLDGKIARSRGMITNFGKFLDPIADKMLTTAAMLGFIVILPSENLKIQMAIITFITLFREFTVASVRLIAVSSASQKVIPANIWGKLKTVAQMTSIIIGLAAYSVNEIFCLSAAFFGVTLAAFMAVSWVSAVLCTVSGLIYLKDSKEFIDSRK
ncbi:MAG: CDP-diacylglycerol--glycerol-3-phosphate 3-phosphatidyltransferase [Clostridia bacterium]|nr:CDP-diacylglycerol--glycerol-3-phosphate 3-phosphatidyltransferase [Clostridia bacterium]